MKKNISSELAIGLVLITALIMGGIFWLTAKKEALQKQLVFQNDVAAASKKGNTKITVSLADKKDDQPTPPPVSQCTPHFYEGEALVHGWLLPGDEAQAENLKVEIKREDIEKLPTTRADSLSAHFTATLVDPTDQVRNDLKNATAGKPALIKIQGYALACQSFPLVSIKQASIAFKRI